MNAGDQDDSQPAPPSSLAGWWLVFVLMLLYALSFLDRQVLSLMVDPIRRSLGISEMQMSLLQGASFAVFFALFGLPMGLAADRLPRRWVIFVGAVFWSLAASGAGFARHFWQLAVARFALGAGEASLLPAGYSLVADSFPPRRLGLAMSLFSLGANVGAGLATIAGAVLIAQVPASGVDVPVLGHFEAWQFVFLLCGLPCLLFSPVIFTVKDRRRGQAPSVAGVAGAAASDALRVIRENPRFYAGHFLGFGLYSACGYAASSWMPTYMMRYHHMSVMEIGLMFGAGSMVGGIAGALLFGLIADRLFARGMRDAHLKIAMAGIALQTALLVIGTTTEHVAVVWVSQLLWFPMMGYAGTAAAAQQMVTPAACRGRISAFYLFVYSLLGAGVGPSVTAFYTQYVIGDDSRVGWGIALAELTIAPLAILALAIAAPAMRRSLAERA